MAKSLLIISRQSPWSGPGAREALDIVLAGGAFDLRIGLLECLAEGLESCNFEGDIIAVNRVHLAIINTYPYIPGIRSCQWPVVHFFHHPF